MTDPRVERLAKVLVHYSLKLKKGQLLKIVAEVPSLPLVEAVYREAIDLGAVAYTTLRVPNNDEYALKHCSDAQLKFIAPWARQEIRKIDAYLGIWGSSNTRYLSTVDPKKMVATRKVQKPIMDVFYKRHAAGELRWCGTQFPTLADAQEADMSLSDYEDFVYRAGHVHAGDAVKHWKKVYREQQRLVKILNRTDRLHIEGEGTDIKMRVKGRKWVNCAGEENFPDGEIFTGPIEDTVEGKIHFSFPAVYGGREVDDVRLEFKNGKVVKESAGKNQEYLTAMLNMDKGARFVGEVAIGTNYEIKKFSRNILFDEKIGGTCHMAVGNSIVESGGLNKSGLHWDMICDLKKGGRVTADGKVVYRNGKFTI